MAAATFTLTNTIRQNLGGGGMFVGGMIAADTGDYATGGHAVSPTFASLDRIGQREPDLVIFRDGDGYHFWYDSANSKVKVFAISCDGNALVNGALTEWGNGVALATAVGADAGFSAFWLPRIP